MNNKPVAWIDYLEFSDVYDLNVSGRGIPLYTHPTNLTEIIEKNKPEIEKVNAYIKLLEEEIQVLKAKTLTDKPHPKCDEACMYLCKMRELTDEEIWELADMVLKNSDVIGFARAILRKAQEK